MMIQRTMAYWMFNAFGSIEQKVKGKEEYDAALREAFR